MNYNTNNYGNRELAILRANTIARGKALTTPNPIVSVITKIAPVAEVMALGIIGYVTYVLLACL